MGPAADSLVPTETLRQTESTEQHWKLLQDALTNYLGHDVALIDTFLH